MIQGEALSHAVREGRFLVDSFSWVAIINNGDTKETSINQAFMQRIVGYPA
jgi:hypothetical protein